MFSLCFPNQAAEEALPEVAQDMYNPLAAHALLAVMLVEQNGFRHVALKGCYACPASVRQYLMHFVRGRRKLMLPIRYRHRAHSSLGILFFVLLTQQ